MFTTITVQKRRAALRIAQPEAGAVAAAAAFTLSEVEMQSKQRPEGIVHFMKLRAAHTVA